MKLDEVLAKLVDAVAKIRADLPRDCIAPGASLVDDLGLDSMRLAALSAEVKAQFDGVDLRGWYMQAARGGSDTLDALAHYVVTAKAA